METLTYQQIITITKNFILANCQNIVNFDGIDSHYKSGYTRVVGTHSGADVNDSGSIVSVTNPIVQVSEDTVNTQFTEITDLMNITNKLDYNVDEINFFPFCLNIIKYCECRVNLTCGQPSNSTTPNSILIYNPNTLELMLNPEDLLTIDPTEDTTHLILDVDQLKTFSETLISSIKNNTRVYKLKYNFQCF